MMKGYMLWELFLKCNTFLHANICHSFIAVGETMSQAAQSQPQSDIITAHLETETPHFFIQSGQNTFPLII